MALQCDPPHLGDIGECEEESEPNPYRLYEKNSEQLYERKK
jgi:hypothetical protein